MPHRTRLAEGVYQDRYGIDGIVTVGTVRQEQRFPLGTDVDTIQAWRSRTKADLLDDKEDADQRPEAGTFAADVERFKKRIARRVSFAADCSHLKAWIPHIGDMPRHSIRPVHVQKAITAWEADGKSARTIRHRRRVLRELYQSLDGAYAKPPLKGVIVPKLSAPHPVPVPWKKVQQVAASLKKGKRHEEGYGDDSVLAHARFLVRATTGQRPAQIMRAEPGDVDLRRKIWFVRAAKGGYQVPLPLNPEMVKAWKAFIAAKAWGRFDLRSFSKTIRRHGWPEDVRPYNLRHTFAIDLILAGADLGEVQAALGHRQIQTTRDHYAPIQLARLKKTMRLSKRGKL